MHKLIDRHAQKLRFLVVGGGLTVIDFGLLFLFVHLSIDKIPANYLSTSVSFIISFIVNGKYTFRGHSGNKVQQFALFILVTICALWIIQPLIITFVTGLPLFKQMNQSVALFIAKLLATAVSLMWNYVLYSKVVFRTHKPL